MMTLLIAFLVVIGFLLGLVRYIESTGVFFPSRTLNSTPDQIGLVYEDAYFKTPDGFKLNGWLVRNPRAASTVIFAHGNAGNISDRLLKVKFFHSLGLNVFIFDYRGYGKSEGKPSERGVYIDAQAAYDFLQSTPDIKTKPVFIYGASLGGIVAIDLGVHRPLAAVVIDSSITNAKEMAKRLYPYLPSWMMGIKFDSLAKIKHLTMPKLFIHSPHDLVVPFDMGRRLFESAPEPKEFLQSNGGHNDAGIATDPQAVGKLIDFLKKYQLL